MRMFRLLAVGVGLAAGSAALASTEEAWDEFRARTEAACRALLPEGAEAEIAVDPYGSERFGIALIRAGAGAAAEVTVCVMDKQDGRAELSGPFAALVGFAPAGTE